MSLVPTGRPLRILHLTLGADAGGLSQYIVTLSKAMHTLGHETIVAGDTGAWQWAFDAAPLEYIHIPLKGGWFQFRRSVKVLRQRLRNNPVDVIHTHYRRATLLGRKLQSRGTEQSEHAGSERTREEPGSPGTQSTNNENSPENDPALRKYAQNRRPGSHKRPPVLYTLHLSHISLKFPRNLLTDFGDYTHAASEDARRWLIDDAHVDPKQIALIPHGVDVNRFSITKVRERESARAALNLRDDDTVAVFVGRLDDPKNEEWMLYVAYHGRHIIPKLKVILVGEGPHEQHLRQLVDKQHLANHVTIVGHQDPLPYYRAADALLLPSTREGFSLVCAEAMATGIPIFRTRTSGTSELVIENITGQSVPINRTAFVNGGIEFLRDRESLRRMGTAAAQRVREKFSFDEQVARTLDLYRSIAKVH